MAATTKILADFPAALIDAFVTYLDGKYPPLRHTEPVTESGRDELNWEAGQRSVVEDLLAARARQQEG